MDKRMFAMGLLVVATGACQARRVGPGTATAPKPGPEYNTGTTGKYSSDTLIITYSKNAGSDALLAAARTFGASVLYTYTIISAIAVRKPEDRTLDETITYFKKVKGVIAVQRDAIMQTQGSAGGTVNAHEQ